MDQAGAAQERLDWLARTYALPTADLAVGITGPQGLAVRRKAERTHDCPRFVFESGCQFVICCVPAMHEISATRGQPAAIRREGKAVHGLRKSSERMRLFAATLLPKITPLEAAQIFLAGRRTMGFEGAARQ